MSKRSSSSPAPTQSVLSPDRALPSHEIGNESADRWGSIVFCAMLLLTFLGLCFPLRDFDFWWHLKTGEWILQTGQIPAIDLYTYIDFDKRWVDLHWGFQVLVALLYRVGGIPLVTLVKAATITAAIGIAWNATGRNLSSWQKALIWIFPIICITGRGNERPEMLTQQFLAMWLWIASRAEKSPRWIWCLPLIQLVWVNCHALFILGLVVGACYGIDVLIRLVLGGRMGLGPRPALPYVRQLMMVGVLVGAVCFINPYFAEGVFFPEVLYRKFSVEKAFYSKNIGEFRPPIDFVLQHGFSNIYLVSEFVAWLIAAGSIVAQVAIQKRFNLFRVLLFTGFSHLAWQASRNTNIFALVAGYVACEQFAEMAPDFSANWSRLVSTHSARCNRWATATISAMCLLVVSGLWNQIAEKNKPFQLGESPNWFMHEAARFAAQPGFPPRAFVSHLGQAEVYLYHNGPEYKVFTDARLEVCTQQSFQRFNDTLEAMATGSPRWMSMYKDSELPVVILDSRVSRQSINGLLLTPSWRLVFADATAAVFLPTELANTLKLPFANPEPLKYPDGPPAANGRGTILW